MPKLNLAHAPGVHHGLSVAGYQQHDTTRGRTADTGSKTRWLPDWLAELQPRRRLTRRLVSTALCLLSFIGQGEGTWSSYGATMGMRTALGTALDAPLFSHELRDRSLS